VLPGVRRSKGRHTNFPRDLAAGGGRPELLWRKRRWRCNEPSCRGRSFTEAVGSVPARKRLTVRLRAAYPPDVMTHLMAIGAREFVERWISARRELSGSRQPEN
jgi:hypothetical protein